MRFVIFGAGAIGGVVGARLAQARFDVTLIARGAHLDAIRARGLRIEDPHGGAALALDVHDAPEAVDWREDDVVLLAVKSQDTELAVRALSACAPASVAIFCLQNGVENERVALRRFANVYGGVVMAPTAHLEPGIVLAYGSRGTGIIDVGRYPSGVDTHCEAVADALERATFGSKPRTDIMRLKYSKLVLNLANAAEASCEPGPAMETLAQLAREEGRTVLTAAGIEFADENVSDIGARWERLGVTEIAGHLRGGSSSWQSLARGTGAVEVDYLNREIVLLGRLHGVATPVNEALAQLGNRLARERAAPASASAQALLDGLGVAEILSP